MPLFDHNVQTHVCTTNQDFAQESCFPPLGPKASCWAKSLRKLRQTFIIWNLNPRSIDLYRTDQGMFNKRIEHINTHINIIHPFSCFRSIYEIWISLISIATLTMIPLNCAFNSALHRSDEYRERNKSLFASYTTDSLETILLLFCVIDMVITFFTGFQSKKSREVILDPKEIARNYLLGPYFITDFVSNLPLFRFMVPLEYRDRFELLTMIKIVRCATMIEYMGRTAELLKITNLMFKAIEYTIILFLILHWYACVHFLIPQVQYMFGGELHPYSWVVEEQLLLQPVSYQYIYSYMQSSSFLFCISTLQLEMGPLFHSLDPWEDPVAKILIYTTGKIIVSIFTVLLLNIFLSVNNLETKYYEVIGEVRSFMKRRKLPIELQKRLILNYKYKYNKRFFKEVVITELLSDQLRKEIKLHVCKKLVQSVAPLAELPSKVLEDILMQLEEEIFLPNDVIMKANTVGECMYFLASGTVTVISPSGREICHLHDGTHFGEISLVYRHKKRMATVIAIEICELYRLDKKAFSKCIERYPPLFAVLETTANLRIDFMTKLEEDVRKMEMENRKIE